MQDVYSKPAHLKKEATAQKSQRDPAEIAGDRSIPIEDRLKAAARIYEYTSDPSEQRIGAIFQLQIVVESLLSLGVGAATLRPLIALRQGILEINEGRKPEMLQPPLPIEDVQRRGRRPGKQLMTDDILMRRGIAAAAMQFHLDTLGHEGGLKGAAKLVADKILDWPATSAVKPDTVDPTPRYEMVMDWREKAMDNDPSRTDAVTFRKLIKERKECDIPMRDAPGWALSFGRLLR